MLPIRNILLTLFFIPFLSEAASVWTAKENFPAQARHRTTAFSIGNKGYVGLGHHNSGPEGNVLYDDFWEYDPATDSWTQIADFGGGIRYHCADFVAEGKGFVFGGQDTIAFFSDLWEYNPSTNTWTEKATLPGGERIGAMSFTMGPYGVIMMGQLASFAVGNDVYGYHVPTDTWYLAPTFAGPPRISGITFVIEGAAYCATGYTYGGSLNDCWKLDTSSWTWSEVANVGPTVRGQAYGCALDGYGYIFSGNDWDLFENYSDCWRYDPVVDEWSQISDFPGLARRYIDGFVVGNKAYMGMGTNGTNLKDLWEFNPANTVELPTENQDESIQLYPNPVVDIVHLSIPKQLISSQVFLANSTGNIVFQSTLNSEETSIDLSTYARGVYYLSVIQDNRLSANRQIVRK